MGLSDLEELRRKFRPGRIATLFVGESPPHNGTFFYKKNSILYREMRKAFNGTNSFLDDFKAKGFFLDDLVLEPINQIKDKKERNRGRRERIRSLAERLREYQPSAIVTVMRAIEPMVHDAVIQAGFEGIAFHNVPFPVRRANQNAFHFGIHKTIPQLPVSGDPRPSLGDQMTTATRTNPLSYLTDQLNDIKAKGTHFRLRVLEDEQAPECTFDGKRVINLASNNYLGLTTHPKLREAALAATKKYGVGSGAVRTITGTMKIHMELEERIARFKNVEACVVFQSGFTANAGTVSAVLGKEDFIISDQLNHASIIDGARLSRAKILVFNHKDMAHAEEQLASVKDHPGRKLLITDGVFSMDGDVGPLPALCDLAEKYGAIMMVDDAHASGVLGRNGRGTIDHFNVHGRVDIQVGTLSKAIGALGGYVCGTRDLIDFLYHRARPFLFSTSHPPSVAATCIAAFDVLEQEPERIENLWQNTRFWKKELGALGFNIGGQTTPASETPITPIIIGDGKLTMDFSRALFNEGVMGTGIAFPTVPEGKARIRTIMTATHTRDELTRALEVLKRVGKKMGILA
jgi:glycine C-acetyltransferase